MTTSERERTPRLDAATMSALADALAAARRDGPDDAALHDALRRVSRESRELGIPPEGLLVTLKQVWHSLQRPAGAPRNHTDAGVLREVVTRCIRQYYAD